MSHNTWVDAVLRLTLGRADQTWHADSPRHTPDYDIPAFIRRGIRIPALDAFHADGADASMTDRCAGVERRPCREES
jgi:hypothetical protein